jgi:hypothetical protein
MRRVEQFIAFLSLLNCMCLHIEAENAAAGSNPYVTIVDRNIFSLVPIPIPPPADTKPPEPPAKITPNGIMSLFGQLQALFKVATPTKPGQPAQDKSYTLSVGEREDDIEVTKIDESARSITFNNHGVVQELSLTNVAVTTAAALVNSAGGFGGSPGAARPPGLPANRFSNRFGQGAPNIPALGNQPNQPPGPNFGGNVGENLSPEAQVIAIEAQRAQLQQQANPPYSPNLLPPTVLTPKNTGDESPAER